VVPRQSKTGGVSGSDNPYGHVVLGNVFKGEGEDFEKTAMDRAIPTTKPRAGVDAKNELAPTEEATAQAAASMPALDGATDYVPPTPVATAQQSAEQEMQYLQSLVSTPEEAPTSAPILPVAVPQELMSFTRKRIRVRISSSKFGNYRGHYLHVVDNPDYLILFYDTDDSGFEPPHTDRDDPISIRCEDKEYKVYYMGMDFDLNMNNLGMQVYIKNKE